jgi:hypothetical protein
MGGVELYLHSFITSTLDGSEFTGYRPTPSTAQPLGLAPVYIYSVKNKMSQSKFNVFHVRALYYTKTLITNKCTKRVLSSIVTHSYMFRPCWVSSGRTFRYLYTRVALYSWVRMCCWLCIALFSEAWTLCGPGRQACRPGPQYTNNSTSHSTQYTINSTSHSTIKCNLSVTIAKTSPWRWSSRVETCRSVLQLMIKFSLCICWWSEFLQCLHI